jgi:hypothetical protein
MNAGPWRLFAAFVAVLGMATLASSASAKTKDIIAPSEPPYTANSGWQAGTCTSDTPTCSVETSEHFFRPAGGHPQVGFTQFIVRYKTGLAGPEEPIDELAHVHVDIPEGFTVNPQATTVQCPTATGEANPESCPAESKVGESLITGSVAGLPSPTTIKADVFNIEPPDGEPALFGFAIGAGATKVFLRTSVAWESDYHEGFTIDVPETPLASVLPGGLILKNRLRFNGRAGDGTFLTTPTTCHEWEEEPAFEHVYSTWLLASSITEESEPGYQWPQSAEPRLESPLPESEKPLDCPGIPYAPSVGIAPNTTQTDSPAGATTEVDIPHPTGGESRESSQTQRGRVTLPLGMSLNPSAAAGLVACTDAEFGKGTRNPVACPVASKIGTVAIDTPPLPDGSLLGNVYVGSQLSRDPASGDEYRIFIDAESKRFDISVRLLGKVVADPLTGQLTTIFSNLPQAPVKSFVIKLDGGPRATLTSPAVCGPHTMATTLTPWTAQWNGKPDPEPSSQFTLTSAPGGGGCPQTLGERPFAPAFEAKSTNTQAAAFTNVNVDVVRSEGNQELKGVDVTLPPGMTAKLAGLRYCPEGAIAAAAANAGLAEIVSPSCAGDSLVGSAVITSGSGPEPLRIETGKAFLAGPYHGAPLSLAVITPATAGPFDLGTVVVRVALFVDPKTAQVKAVSDPLPHIYGGALLDLRTVSVKIDRPNFSLNGTNCSPSSFAGTLRGGGSNPADPAAFTSVSASSPYQVTGCDSLPFGPKLYLRTFGATKRAKNPKLRAIFVARRGDANVSRAAVTLPKSMILDQGAISQVCTRVQFAAGDCPSNSVYGFAEATTPLLDGPLKGPVYLRSSDNPLPDLVAALHGQVDVELAGRTDTVNGRLRNTFDVVPDVPVSRFVLTIRGGKKKGLLVNSQNLCARKQFAKLNLTAQNGKKLKKKKLKLRTPCKKKRGGVKGSR